jgi:hypothetical protein
MTLWISSLGGAILLIILWNSYEQAAKQGLVERFYLVAAFVVVSAAVVLYLQIRKYAAELRSYRLTINDTSITQSQRDRKDMTISLNSICLVSYQAGSWAFIQGDAPYSTLMVPEGLEELPELLETLAQYQTVKPFQPSWQNTIKSLAPFIGLLMGFIFVMRTTNVPVTIVGTLAYGILTIMMLVSTWQNTTLKMQVKLQNFGAVLFIWGLLAMKIWAVFSGAVR